MFSTVSRIAMVAVAASSLTITSANAVDFLIPDPNNHPDIRNRLPRVGDVNGTATEGANAGAAEGSPGSDSERPPVPDHRIPRGPEEVRQMLEEQHERGVRFVSPDDERNAEIIRSVYDRLTRAKEEADRATAQEAAGEDAPDWRSPEERERFEAERERLMREMESRTAGDEDDPEQRERRERVDLSGDGSEDERLQAREAAAQQMRERQDARRERQQAAQESAQEALERSMRERPTGEGERERQRQPQDNDDTATEAEAEAQERAAAAPPQQTDESAETDASRESRERPERAAVNAGAAAAEAVQQAREPVAPAVRDRLNVRTEVQAEAQGPAAAAAAAQAAAAARTPFGSRFDVNASPSPGVLRDLVRNAPMDPMTLASIAAFAREAPPAPEANDSESSEQAEPTAEETRERNQEQLVERVVRDNPPDEDEPEPTEPEPAPEPEPDPEPEPVPEPEPEPDFPYHDAWMLGDYEAPAEPPLESLAGSATATFEGEVYGTFHGVTGNEDFGGTISLNVDFDAAFIEGVVAIDDDRGELTVEAGWTPGVNRVEGAIWGRAFGGMAEGGNLEGHFLGPKGEELAGHWNAVVTHDIEGELGGIEAGFKTRQ